MIDYIEGTIREYTLAFPSQIRVIEHMLCVNGNGVDATTFGPASKHSYERDGEWYTYTVGGSFLDPEAIKKYKVVPMDSMSSWYDNERYQSFRDLLPLKGTDQWEGLQEAVRYFLKCLAITTPETIECTVKSYEFALYCTPEEIQSMIERFTKDVDDWQKNSHILNELFEV